MARGKYYYVQQSGDDWALYSPAGVRVKLYSASRYGTSQAAFAAANREATSRNYRISVRR
jgi:hypothetical protein